MQGMGERVIYQDSLVTITTARAVIGGTTYAMANITSVRQFTEPANIGCLVLLAVGGCVLGTMFIVNNVGFGWFLLVVGAAIAAIAYAQRRSKHWVRIGTAGAETNAIWSHDAAWTQQVVGAMTNAIVARG